MQSTKVLPVSLQPSKVALKKEVLRKSQATKAELMWVDALNRQLVKTQDSKVAPWLVDSVRSTSWNVQSR